MIFIGYETETGRPLGFASAPDPTAAQQSWPDHSVIEYQGDGVPDLSTLWIEDETLITRTGQGAAEDLTEAKKTARRLLADQVNQFIRAKTEAEGGGNRYDDGFKISVLNYKIEYRAALATGGLSPEIEAGISAKLARIGELEAWMNAVMAEYQRKAGAVLAATTISEAQAVTLDLDKFMIGATGDGTLPDPDVFLSEIA